MNSDTSVARSGPAANLAAPFLDLLAISGLTISVIDSAGQQSTIHASDSTAARLEEMQYDLGEGPLFEAFRSASPEIVTDLSATAASRWPAFAEAVAPLHVSGIYAFPLLMGAACVGVAMAYRHSPGALDHSAVERGQSLARAIAIPALERARRLADEEPSGSSGADGSAGSAGSPGSDESPGSDRSAGSPGSDESPGSDRSAGSGASLSFPRSNGSRGFTDPPVEMRRDVHQATGMVLAQLDSTATEALSRIRAHAFAGGRTVHDVAHDVITRHLDFSTLPD